MELLLNRQELLDCGNNLRGVEINCHEGQCWITQEGDNRDHILREGSGLKVSSNGRLVITAMERCRIMLNEPSIQGQTETNVFCRWLKKFEVVNLQTG